MRPPASVSGTRWTRCTPGFEFQPREDVTPADRRARLLEAAKPGLRQVEDLKAPTAQRRISLVHAKKLGCE